MQCTYINKFGSRCEEKIFKNLKECVLHCTEKEIHNDEYEDYRKAFYDFLSEYVFEEIEKKFQNFWNTNDPQTIAELESQENDRNTFLRLIGGVKETELSPNLKKHMRKTDLILDEIKFPNDIAMQGLNPNAILILKNLGRVIFKNCEFNSYSAMLFAEFYHEHCNFRRGARINPFPDLKDDHKYRYMYCRFQSDVEVMSSIYSKEIKSNLFYECIFDEKITMSDVNFNKNVFYFPEFNEDFRAGEKSNNFLDFKRYYTIKQLSIQKCCFELSLKLNGFNEKDIGNIKKICYFDSKDLITSNISIRDSKFRSKFEIKHRIIENFKFENSNVDGIFDVYKSYFINTRFYKVIFEEFAAFEYVVFGDGCIENKADFIYVTFKDFSNFRDTNFKSGLNFSRANLKQEPNFLNAIINVNYTDRETLRIIKNSFEKVNNRIESNRFFIHEMSSYRKEIKGVVHSKVVYVKIIEYNKKIINCIDRKIDCIIGFNNSIFVVFFISVITSTFILFQTIFFLLRIPIIIFKYISNNFNFKYLVLNINYFISGFGESYIRPIMIFLVSIGIYTYIEIMHKSIFKENSLLKDFMTQGWFVSLSEFLNACATNVPLFSKALENKSGIEFISLLFFIWFGILTWQIIIAVKRNTQH